jgi:hypothetical protein
MMILNVVIGISAFYAEGTNSPQNNRIDVFLDSAKEE